APSATTRARPARGERRDGERGERGRRRLVIAREAIRPADARTAARVGSGPHARTHDGAGTVRCRPRRPVGPGPRRPGRWAGGAASGRARDLDAPRGAPGEHAGDGHGEHARVVRRADGVGVRGRRERDGPAELAEPYLADAPPGGGGRLLLASLGLLALGLA